MNKFCKGAYIMIRKIFISKNLYILFVLIAIFLFFSIKSYSDAVSFDLSSSVFRLHVIANSDSKEDQDLKLKVRDSLINYMNSLITDDMSKNDIINISRNHLDDFRQIAKQTITKNGYNYDVNVEIGNYSFPTKSYGDISFPCGNYDALRVKIGDAKGQNWWCVMFPPLCFIDVTSATVPEESKKNLEENLSNEDYRLISKSSDSSEVKFKMVEIFNSISSKTASK